MALHFALLYVPFLQGLFSVVPLDLEEWKAVLLISLPIIGIDEGLKWVERGWWMEVGRKERKEERRVFKENGKARAKKVE